MRFGLGLGLGLWLGLRPDGSKILWFEVTLILIQTLALTLTINLTIAITQVHITPEIGPVSVYVHGTARSRSPHKK